MRTVYYLVTSGVTANRKRLKTSGLQQPSGEVPRYPTPITLS